ncbi:MAG: DJ-1/PfpI family protein [Kiritimatiellaeota bacterium]|nr:DJ-1/PfpI family protein [Kiritimatiellota bacterium]
MTSALLPLADGVEELEAVAVLDILRRAGWRVVAAGLRPGPVTASRGVRLLPDANWDDLDLAAFDALVVPGGGRGVAALRQDARVRTAVRDFFERGKLVAAICAGPLVLQDAGVLAGRRATCHPDVAPELTATPCVDAAVVTDGRLVTSQGAGTALEFALALVALVDGAAQAEKVARSLALRPPPFRRGPGPIK